jgi:hypothetical protein
VSPVWLRCLHGQDLRRKGNYARNAIDIWGGRAGTISSPDGKKRIVVQPPRKSASGDETHFVLVEAFGQEFPSTIGDSVNAEVGWSPDSAAFFLSYSDGGNIGTYHVQVFYVTVSGLRMIEPIEDGRRLLTPNCFEPEWANVAAIKWMRSDSSSLLIAAEVPPHSSCASMGTFRAFEIGLPDGRVLAEYDQIAAKKSFRRDLGVELRNADDTCIRTPERCVPPGLPVQAQPH